MFDQKLIVQESYGDNESIMELVLFINITIVVGYTLLILLYHLLLSISLIYLWPETKHLIIPNSWVVAKENLIPNNDDPVHYQWTQSLERIFTLSPAYNLIIHCLWTNGIASDTYPRIEMNIEKLDHVSLSHFYISFTFWANKKWDV